MKSCFHIGRRLWAYCDGMVSLQERARIEEHIEACASCRGRAAYICENIHLMRQFVPLEPGDELWDRIEKGFIRLELSGDVIPKRQLRFGEKRILRPAAIVASLAIISTALFLATRYGLLGSQKGEFNLADYLNQVSAVASADTNLKDFPAATGFTNVSLPEARDAVNFPVISPGSLPGGYVLTAVRLYTGEDFSALQLKYRGEQGGLCVFQSPVSLNVSFGKRQSERCTTGGLLCNRTSSQSCSVYRFMLGETQCALMISQTDPSAVGGVIRAFSAEYERTQ